MKGFCQKTMEIVDITLAVGVNGGLLKCSACGIIRLGGARHHIGLPGWLAKAFQGVVRQVRAEQALELWQRWFAESGNPIYAGECGGELRCFFCGEYQVHTDSDAHREGCAFVAAKRLVEQVARIHNRIHPDCRCNWEFRHEAEGSCLKHR